MSSTGGPVAAVGDFFVVHMDREALNDRNPRPCRRSNHAAPDPHGQTALAWPVGRPRLCSVILGPGTP